MNNIRKQLEGYLNTPPLWIDKELFGLQQFVLPNSNIPEDLCLTSAIPSFATNYVMGKRVESFFELVINYSERYNITAENLQVHKSKITTGELDFLIEDVILEQHLHIEVGYKFYVYDPNFEQELERWIGPNRKDSLLQKIGKLKNNQLPLIFTPEAIKVLNSYNLQPENLYQQVSFKANLFIPKSLEGKEFLYINNKCIAGYWISFSEFTELEYDQFSFFAPKKQDWPSKPQSNEEWVNFAEITTQIIDFLSRRRSPLIWMKKTDKVYERFFVVWWQEKKDEDAV
jgi:hypothetical protein